MCERRSKKINYINLYAYSHNKVKNNLDANIKNYIYINKLCNYVCLYAPHNSRMAEDIDLKFFFVLASWGT